MGAQSFIADSKFPPKGLNGEFLTPHFTTKTEYFDRLNFRPLRRRHACRVKICDDNVVYCLGAKGARGNQER